MESLATLLREHPFVASLDERFVETIAACATDGRFAAGSYIFHEGEDAGGLYLIRSGCVALEIAVPKRDPLEIQTVGAGEVLGWSWLVPPYQWRFDAHVIEEARAIVVDGERLRARCEQDHDLGYALLKQFTITLGQRLDATRMQLIDVYGVPV